MRHKRGKLEGEKRDNRLFVWVNTDQTEDPTAEDTTSPRGTRDELLEAYRDQIVFLRRELERKDHLLAAALERIPPQLEAPSEPSESPETATVEEPDHPGGDQEGAQRPWWRRVFRG